MNNLKHPNIIKAYEFFFGDTKNAPSILLEYCNHSLESYIKKMNNSERSDAIIDFCNVMKFVHKAGIIHRDLKPSNILIDENNKIKLSDFGICTLISNEYETITTFLSYDESIEQHVDQIFSSFSSVNILFSKLTSKMWPKRVT